MSSRNIQRLMLAGVQEELADPGNAGTINTRDNFLVSVPIVTAAAETRTVAAPEYVGQQIDLYLKTDGGNCTITVTGGYDQAGSTSLTFSDVGDSAFLKAIDDNGTIRWELYHYVSGSAEVEAEAISALGLTATTNGLTVTAGGITVTAGDTTVASGHGVSVGSTTQNTISDGDGSTNLIPEVQLHGVGTAFAGGALQIATYNATNTRAVSPKLAFVKGAAATQVATTAVADNEVCGSIIAYGSDGTDFESPLAAIEFVVDDASGPTTGEMGGSIEFHVTADGGETLTKRWTIDVSGNLVAATANDIVVPANTSAALEVSDATTKLLVVDSRNTIKDVNGVLVTSPATTIASETATHSNPSLKCAAKTVTYTGTTGTTYQKGAQLYVGTLTITDADAMTLDAASAVHIDTLAAAGGMLTITASYMISTGVSDCYLTNAGVWTDTACWEYGKQAINSAADAAAQQIDNLLDQLTLKTWEYRDDVHGHDFGRQRVGITYDDLPGELRCPGKDRGVNTGVLASFALAALKKLRDENRSLESRLAALEAR